MESYGTQAGILAHPAFFLSFFLGKSVHLSFVVRCGDKFDEKGGGEDEDIFGKEGRVV